MERLQKKCLFASAGMHLFLMLLLVFGSAFFVSREKPPLQLPRINMVPGKLVDDLLAGGGGNPKLAMTEDRVKGETLLAPPEPPAEPKPPAPKPEKPQPKVQAPAPKPDKVPTVDNKKTGPKPSTTKKPDISELLTKVTRNPADKRREAAEAAAKKEAAAAAAAQQRRANEMRSSLSKALGRSARAVSEGFTDGTKVEVGGPGGVAYANYAAFVREAFANEWDVSPDLALRDGIVVVEVVVVQGWTVYSQTNPRTFQHIPPRPLCSAGTRQRRFSPSFS